MTIHYEDATVTLHHGDCLDVLASLPDASVDAVVTDPPYLLGFMGKQWDTRAGHEHLDWHRAWCDHAFRVLKPGGHLLAFGGTRTWHRLACAVEDAGFEVRDSIAWLYGQGFPKSLNVSAALNSARCRCDVGEWPYGTGESATEHGLRDVPGADVPPPEGSARGAGSVLLPSLPEQGSPAAGRAELRTPEDGAGERGMEGRGDLPQGEGQLRRPEVRALPAGVLGDGTDGRLHHGAPSGDGAVGGSDADPLGVRESQEPRPAGQPQGEPRALPDQRGPQAWGGWPVCGRCSQPVIPDGLGTAAKPAFEPVVVARKPLSGTVAQTVLAHGTGALNIDACRVDSGGEAIASHHGTKGGDVAFTRGGSGGYRPGDAGAHKTQTAGRWPANVVLDEDQAAALDEQSGEVGGSGGTFRDVQRSALNASQDGSLAQPQTPSDYGKADGASRFMYVAKADTSLPGHPLECGCEHCEWERDRGTLQRFLYTPKAPTVERVKVDGIAHPTVKPLALMRWLVRLVTPPGGTVLEPFAGSGTTVEACILEGFNIIAIEREADYLPLITQRIHRRKNPVEAVRGSIAEDDDMGLFDLLDQEGPAA